MKGATAVGAKAQARIPSKRWASTSNHPRWSNHIYLLVLLTGAILFRLGLPPAHAVPFAYITNYYSNSVTVIDTAGPALGPTVLVGHGPYGTAVHPAGTFVYGTNH